MTARGIANGKYQMTEKDFASPQEYGYYLRKQIEKREAQKK